MFLFTVITFPFREKIKHISHFVLGNFVIRLVNLTQSGGLRLWSCTGNPVHAARRCRRDDKVPEEGDSVLPRHQLPHPESGCKTCGVHSRSLLLTRQPFGIVIVRRCRSRCELVWIPEGALLIVAKFTPRQRPTNSRCCRTLVAVTARRDLQNARSLPAR